MKRFGLWFVVALSFFGGILPTTAQENKIVAVGICESPDKKDSNLCPVYEDMTVELIVVPGKVSNVRYVDPEWIVSDQEDTSKSTYLTSTRFNWGAQHPSHVYLANLSYGLTAWQRIDDCEGTQSCSLYSVVGDNVYYSKQNGAYEGNNGSDYYVAYKETSFHAYSLASGATTEVQDIPRPKKNPDRLFAFSDCNGPCWISWAFTFQMSPDKKIAVTNFYWFWEEPHFGTVVNGTPIDCIRCTFPIWVQNGALFASNTNDFVYAEVKNGTTTVTHKKLDFTLKTLASPFN